MGSEVRSCEELQAACLEALKKCQGFEQVNDVLVQPRETSNGLTNWTLAAVRPKVGNDALRSARGTIEALQRTYRLDPLDARRSQVRKRR
jgi:hypothetical protein